MINEEELKEIVDKEYEDKSRLFSELAKYGVAFQTKHFPGEMDSLLKNLDDDPIYWGGGEDGDIAIAKTAVPGLLVVRGDGIKNPYYIPTTKDAKIVVNQLKIAFGELERVLQQYGTKTR